MHALDRRAPGIEIVISHGKWAYENSFSMLAVDPKLRYSTLTLMPVNREPARGMTVTKRCFRISNPSARVPVAEGTFLQYRGSRAHRPSLQGLAASGSGIVCPKAFPSFPLSPDYPR